MTIFVFLWYISWSCDIVVDTQFSLSISISVICYIGESFYCTFYFTLFKASSRFKCNPNKLYLHIFWRNVALWFCSVCCSTFENVFHLSKYIFTAGVVDSSVAERGICILDWVPVCGLLFPWVWYLDPVCVCWLHPSTGPGCTGQ